MNATGSSRRLFDRVTLLPAGVAMVDSLVWSHARFDTAWQRIEAARGEGRLREAAGAAEQLVEDAMSAGAAAYPEAPSDLALAQLTLARILRPAGVSERALSLLLEAQRVFATLENDDADHPAPMVTVCLGEQAECLLRLGRLEDAAAVAEDCIHRAQRARDERSLPFGYARLATVRLRQRRYQQALSAYSEALTRFEQQGDSRALATTLYQTASVFLETGQIDSGERAYRGALALYTELSDTAAQADTLTQLGNVCQMVVGRADEAIAFYRDAAGKYNAIGDIAGEGRSRSNLGYLLLTRARLDPARQEINRALVCQAQVGVDSEPWKTWSTLEQIETAAGNRDAAATARHAAIESYLAYRRAGGENPTKAGQLSNAVTRSLLAGDEATARVLLQQTQAIPNLPDSARALTAALISIVAGNRSRDLADHPALEYAMAAEILRVIELLEKT